MWKGPVNKTQTPENLRQKTDKFDYKKCKISLCKN